VQGSASELLLLELDELPELLLLELDELPDESLSPQHLSRWSLPQRFNSECGKARRQ
jgi:hypothetical protein